MTPFLNEFIFINELVYIFDQFSRIIRCHHFSVYKSIHRLHALSAVTQATVFNDIQIRIFLQYFLCLLRTLGKIADAKLNDWKHFISPHIAFLSYPKCVSLVKV